MPSLSWLHKQHAEQAAAKVPHHLLIVQSVHGDTTAGNLLIQGDNLLALKALLPAYRGRVKCIFIDPPYNTQSAFEHYNDKLEHSLWLTMMLPRLQLLRDLLSEDGSIWVTIDDNEGHYLKVLMDEVFGRGNFVANALWQKVYSERMDAIGFSNDHDHLLCYSKSNKFVVGRLAKSQNAGQFKFVDEATGLPYRRRSLRKEGSESLRADRPSMWYPIAAPDGTAGHLAQCSERQALRNQHHPFLPSAQTTDVFGVPFVFSTLQRRLRSLGKFKAGGEQWFKTIENFQKKGLRAEEFECSELVPDLVVWDENDHPFTAHELADLCNFKALRLSVIPVVSNAERQIQFAQPPERALKKTRKLPKAQMGQTRGVAGFDPVLGYRIEEVVHQTLWGPESDWQAVKHDGTVLRDAWGHTLHRTRDAATALAAFHASKNFPKRLALGQFARYSWTGGKDYREWLITLPYLPATYLSGHFKVRNVLAHVRCDVRLGADDERVLMLQEVQSDWAQRARRAISVGVMRQDDEVPPPFMKEWAALVMKLVMLHAVHQGLDAVAWTRGAQQVHRWNGLGAGGLLELYDRTLPREVNWIMKPFGGACEALGVFVPTNFSIRQTENGYEVYSPGNELLGIAPTLEDARAYVPDQGHERLYEVHGVRLPSALRKAILDSGFPAWG